MISNMSEQHIMIQKGRSRVQKIFTKLQMFKGSMIYLDVFTAEYETYFNVQLENDLEKYFDNKDFILVLDRHLTDLVSFHYGTDDDGKFNQMFLRALHDFQVHVEPQKRMCFSVVGFNRAVKPPSRSFPRPRPLLNGYTSRGVGGVYTSDESE